MATTVNERYHPRQGPPSLRARKMHLEDSNGDGMRLPANMFAQLFEKSMAPIIGGGHAGTYSVSGADGWSLVVGGTGDAIANHTNGGILITAPSDDDFDVTMDSVLAFTPTTGKWYSMCARIAASDANGIGFKIGMTTGGSVAPLPFGTNYTDAVCISKAITDETVQGAARGNSGTQDLEDLAEAGDGTAFEVGFAVYVHATTPRGYWTYRASTAEEPTVTAFSAEALTQVAAILTSPPTMFWTIHVTGVTATTPTLAVGSFIAGGDR